MVTFKSKYSFFIWFKGNKKKSHSFLNVHDSQTVLVHGTNVELMSWLQQQKEKKREKKTWAHVHWYDRSTQLVTVSGTQKHTTPEAQEAVCIRKEPRHYQNIVKKHTLTHSNTHNPPGRYVSAGSSSSVTVNIITA